MFYTWPLYGVAPSFLAFWGSSKDQQKQFKELLVAIAWQEVSILWLQAMVDEGEEGLCIFFESGRDGRK